MKLRQPLTSAPLKQRGIRIAVLCTTYYPLPSDPWYRSRISPLQNGIGTDMSECASPGLHSEASPSDGISEAMQAMIKKIVSQPLLTN